SVRDRDPDTEVRRSPSPQREAALLDHRGQLRNGFGRRRLRHYSREDELWRLGEGVNGATCRNAENECHRPHEAKHQRSSVKAPSRIRDAIDARRAHTRAAQEVIGVARLLIDVDNAHPSLLIVASVVRIRACMTWPELRVRTREAQYRCAVTNGCRIV